jgi:hypothetical protein
MEEQKRSLSLKINPIYVAIFLIFVLIIISIFVYIKYGMNKTENKDVDNFINDFKDTINEYYNSDLGFNDELNLNVPTDVKEICFANIGEIINEDIDANLKDLLKVNRNYNMFILPIKFFKIAYYRIPNLIVLEENPLCIKTNGKLEAYVDVINYKNKKSVELYTKQKSLEQPENKNMDNKTILQGGLSELQIAACETADENKNCNLLQNIGIITKEDCCSKLNLCC